MKITRSQLRRLITEMTRDGELRRAYGFVPFEYPKGSGHMFGVQHDTYQLKDKGVASTILFYIDPETGIPHHIDTQQSTKFPLPDKEDFYPLLDWYTQNVLQ